MPLQSNATRERQTQALRQRIRNLTRYEPDSVTSEEGSDDNAQDASPRVQQLRFNIPDSTVKYPITGATSALHEQGMYFEEHRVELTL